MVVAVLKSDLSHLMECVDNHVLLLSRCPPHGKSVQYAISTMFGHSFEQILIAKNK